MDGIEIEQVELYDSGAVYAEMAAPSYQGEYGEYDVGVNAFHNYAAQDIPSDEIEKMIEINEGTISRASSWSEDVGEVEEDEEEQPPQFKHVVRLTATTVHPSLKAKVRKRNARRISDQSPTPLSDTETIGDETQKLGRIEHKRMMVMQLRNEEGDLRRSVRALKREQRILLRNIEEIRKECPRCKKRLMRMHNVTTPRQDWWNVLAEQSDDADDDDGVGEMEETDEEADEMISVQDSPVHSSRGRLRKINSNLTDGFVVSKIVRRTHSKVLPPFTPPEPAFRRPPPPPPPPLLGPDGLPLPKRPRGRPRKYPMTPPIVGMQGASGSSPYSTTPSMEDELSRTLRQLKAERSEEGFDVDDLPSLPVQPSPSPSPPKRGRGRPKRIFRPMLVKQEVVTDVMDRTDVSTLAVPKNVRRFTRGKKGVRNPMSANIKLEEGEVTFYEEATNDEFEMETASSCPESVPEENQREQGQGKATGVPTRNFKVENVQLQTDTEEPVPVNDEVEVPLEPVENGFVLEKPVELSTARPQRRNVRSIFKREYQDTLEEPVPANEEMEASLQKPAEQTPEVRGRTQQNRTQRPSAISKQIEGTQDTPEMPLAVNDIAEAEESTTIDNVVFENPHGKARPKRPSARSSVESQYTLEVPLTVNDGAGELEEPGQNVVFENPYGKTRPSSRRLGTRIVCKSEKLDTQNTPEEPALVNDEIASPLQEQSEVPAEKVRGRTRSQKRSARVIVKQEIAEPQFTPEEPVPSAVSDVLQEPAEEQTEGNAESTATEKLGEKNRRPLVKLERVDSSASSSPSESVNLMFPRRALSIKMQRLDSPQSPLKIVKGELGNLRNSIRLPPELFLDSSGISSAESRETTPTQRCPDGGPERTKKKLKVLLPRLGSCPIDSGGDVSSKCETKDRSVNVESDDERSLKERTHLRKGNGHDELKITVCNDDDDAPVRCADRKNRCVNVTNDKLPRKRRMPSRKRHGKNDIVTVVVSDDDEPLVSRILPKTPGKKVEDGHVSDRNNMNPVVLLDKFEADGAVTKRRSGRQIKLTDKFVQVIQENADLAYKNMLHLVADEKAVATEMVHVTVENPVKKAKKRNLVLNPLFQAPETDRMTGTGTDDDANVSLSRGAILHNEILEVNEKVETSAIVSSKNTRKSRSSQRKRPTESQTSSGINEVDVTPATGEMPTDSEPADDASAITQLATPVAVASKENTRKSRSGQRKRPTESQTNSVSNEMKAMKCEVTPVSESSSEPTENVRSASASVAQVVDGTTEIEATVLREETPEPTKFTKNQRKSKSSQRKRPKESGANSAPNDMEVTPAAEEIPPDIEATVLRDEASEPTVDGADLEISDAVKSKANARNSRSTQKNNSDPAPNVTEASSNVLLPESVEDTHFELAVAVEAKKNQRRKSKPRKRYRPQEESDVCVSVPDEVEDLEVNQIVAVAETAATSATPVEASSNYSLQDSVETETPGEASKEDVPDDSVDAQDAAQNAKTKQSLTTKTVLLSNETDVGETSATKECLTNLNLPGDNDISEKEQHVQPSRSRLKSKVQNNDENITQNTPKETGQVVDEGDSGKENDQKKTKKTPKTAKRQAKKFAVEELAVPRAEESANVLGKGDGEKADGVDEAASEDPFIPGDLVWAKAGAEKWPAIVVPDETVKAYIYRDAEMGTVSFYVQAIDHHWRSWIKISDLEVFDGTCRPSPNDKEQSWQSSFATAMNYLEKSPETRLSLMKTSSESPITLVSPSRRSSRPQKTPRPGLLLRGATKRKSKTPSSAPKAPSIRKNQDPAANDHPPIADTPFVGQNRKRPKSIKAGPPVKKAKLMDVPPETKHPERAPSEAPSVQSTSSVSSSLASENSCDISKLRKRVKNFLFKDVPDAKLCFKCGKISPPPLQQCKGVCGGVYHTSCAEYTDGESLPADWVCSPCKEGKNPCFVCKQASGTRQMCLAENCGKFYHAHCLEMFPQTKFNNGVRQNRGLQHDGDAMEGPLPAEILLCAFHTCHTCSSDNPPEAAFVSAKQLVTCIKCPTAFHDGEFCIPAATKILTKKQILCQKHYNDALKKKLKPVNSNHCMLCMGSGKLTCCDSCPAAVHAECLPKPPSDGDYFCDDCESGKFPLYGDVVWAKYGHYRWWPAHIVYPHMVPDNVLSRSHQQHQFVVQFFGTHDYAWLRNGSVCPLIENDTLSKILKRSQAKSLDVKFNQALAEAEAERKSRSSVLTKYLDEHSQPPKYIKIRSNRYPAGIKETKISMEECECGDKGENCGPSSQCHNRSLHMECHASCGAGEKCENQRFQKRSYPPLKTIRTPNRGWGLQCLVNIEKGDFIIEYVGEIVDDQELKIRFDSNRKAKVTNYYFLKLDNNLHIDAGPMGNLSRFMNHSCSPNCTTEEWVVNGQRKIGLFAVEDIPAGTELTFNYKWESLGTSSAPCQCGADKCTGVFGKSSKMKKNKSTTAQNPA